MSGSKTSFSQDTSVYNGELERSNYLFSGAKGLDSKEGAVPRVHGKGKQENLV